VRKADSLPPSCAVVIKSGNLNFLELSGLVQARNGTARRTNQLTALGNSSIFYHLGTHILIILPYKFDKYRTGLPTGLNFNVNPCSTHTTPLQAAEIGIFFRHTIFRQDSPPLQILAVLMHIAGNYSKLINR